MEQEKRKNLYLLIVFAILHIVIFMVIFKGAFPDNDENSVYVGDSRSLYFFYADRIFNGDQPYEDFDIEYAPFSLPIFLFPRLFAESDIGYHIWFALEMLIFDLIGVFILWKLARQFGRSAFVLLSVYTLGLLALGPTVADHFDLAAAVIVLVALYSFIRGWNIVSFSLLAVGTMIKIFPIVIIPILGLYLLRHQEYRSLIKGGLAFGGTLMVICVPGLIIDLGGFIDSFTYHSDRGLQVESTYSSILLLGDAWGIYSIETEMVAESGSWEVVTSLADTLATISPVVTILSLALAYGIYARRQWRDNLSDHRMSHTELINFSLLAIIIFLLANKVFSPQYIIWLYPLIPLVFFRWRIILWTLFVVVGLMTIYIFSFHYDYILSDHYLDLAHYHEPSAIYVLFSRNLLLLVMALLLILAKPYSVGPKLGVK